MRYVNTNGAYRLVAASCLKHALKEGDVDFAVHNQKLFSALCDILDIDELEVLVALRKAKDKHTIRSE